jgi:hypothetical protein
MAYHCLAKAWCSASYSHLVGGSTVVFADAIQSGSHLGFQYNIASNYTNIEKWWHGKNRSRRHIGVSTFASQVIAYLW